MEHSTQFRMPDGTIRDANGKIVGSWEPAAPVKVESAEVAAEPKPAPKKPKPRGRPKGSKKK